MKKIFKLDKAEILYGASRYPLNGDFPDQIGEDFTKETIQTIAGEISSYAFDREWTKHITEARPDFDLPSLMVFLADGFSVVYKEV